VSLVSINMWKLAGDNLNITCNILYCNHQVNRDIWSPCTYNVILWRRVRITIVIVGRQHCIRCVLMSYISLVNNIKKIDWCITVLLWQIYFSSDNESCAGLQTNAWWCVETKECCLLMTFYQRIIWLHIVMTGMSVRMCSDVCKCCSQAIYEIRRK
jgi:hypothetical protein